MSKRLTRSTVNEQQYSAEAFPKSGFNLTHRRYSSYILGRIQCTGYQDCMPGDKIAGKNDGTFTFNNIVTPMMPNVDVQQYNFYQPFRAIDRTFERAFAPSKDNNMSAAWSTPKISTARIVNILLTRAYPDGPMGRILDIIISYMRSGIPFLSTPFTAAIVKYNQDNDTNFDVADFLFGEFNTNDTGVATQFIAALRDTTNPLGASFKNLYLDDVINDIEANFKVHFGTRENPAIDSSTTVPVFLYTLLDCILSPFVGRYSYYYDFKYNYVRPKDLYNLCNNPVSNPDGGFVNLFNMFDDTLMCEYSLRIMYTIWYEYWRNVDLEPVSPNLPYWRDFGSSSVVMDNLAMLVYRPRPWYEDMFISAQIDDLSRHVWAPIVNSSNEQVIVNDSDLNTLDTQVFEPFGESSNGGQLKPSSYILGWRDQVTGQNKTITCPVPTNINDILSSVDKSFVEVYGLDLNSLRQAQQMERYLKRNYLFGDEYNDRMLAHYNSRVSDLRINRPELVSQSFNSSDNKQEIANMSNGISNAGDRTATATIKSSGDDYSMFCEEFGMLVHIITFMPTACYDGVHPQLLLSKVEDFPLPEFATNNEEFGRKIEIAASGLDLPDEAKNMFGRYAAYHAWRARVDEVGGMFLDELQDCTFRRFWGFGVDSIPKLNYHFIHCRPSLQMFRNSNVYDSQIYGDIVHECYVERVLPTPVEKI